MLRPKLIHRPKTTSKLGGNNTPMTGVLLFRSCLSIVIQVECYQINTCLILWNKFLVVSLLYTPPSHQINNALSL